MDEMMKEGIAARYRDRDVSPARRWWSTAA
jgi:hypothetical protein